MSVEPSMTTNSSSLSSIENLSDMTADVQKAYREYIRISKYSRWVEGENRRETWRETVTRYCSFLKKSFPGITEAEYDEVFQAIYNQEVMPSMRALATAGPALELENIAAYNCSYVRINRPRVFAELLYILMCGTGVGFSVERQYINSLPTVPNELREDASTIVNVSDSKIGWARALEQFVDYLYSGKIPAWDISKVRPKGSRIKTFGGIASGPQVLVDLFKYTMGIFNQARGRKLQSIECHDLCCKIAEGVMCGGTRRSALISLSNLSDLRMRNAKTGRWFDSNPQRAMSNNSVAYTEKPNIGIFMDEWKSLYDSRSGERGIFNRVAAKTAVARSGRRDANYDFGCNPCSEIILRDCQMCNLSEVVIRPTDNKESLLRKVRLATIIGTVQATWTNFHFVSPAWKEACEAERLLGVSLTGIFDNPLTYTLGDELKELLTALRLHAVEVNAAYAARLGIHPAAAITCTKPSGTVSQLVDCASGIHPRHSRYYIRTIRNANPDPLTAFMKSIGIPNEPEAFNDNGTVFSFPLKVPDEAFLRRDLTAIDHLKYWLFYLQNYCEHKVSATISIAENEWLDVGAWVYKNFDEIAGVAFLSYDGNIYPQAPYQEINQTDYEKLLKTMPKNIDWDGLRRFEKWDNYKPERVYACTGDRCEL
jgi:ribonucleoside-diphosphate reductase alpha chain